MALAQSVGTSGNIVSNQWRIGIISYKILRQEVSYNDGKLRVKVIFFDRSTAALFEYVKISEGNIILSKYSFHWQDEKGKLKCRWDNAPHHPKLPNAPHHRQNSDESVSGSLQHHDILSILGEIQQVLISEQVKK